MAVNPALIKAAVALATDKRTWIVIGSVIGGVILMIVGIVAAFLNIFSFDDSGSATASAAYVQFIDSMKQSYSKLDAAADSTGGTLDKEQIHAVFYTLYFGEERNMTDQFYHDFVECFVSRSIDSNGNEIVSQCDLNTALVRLAALTGKMAENITQQQVDELCSVLRYGIQTAGNDGTEYSGPAPSAYSDAVFAQLMEEATKYIGYPYVWGGSSPSTSFDCSGFVCWAYTHSGVYNLPRTTAQAIYNQCAKITRAEAKPGDLVFFTRTYVTSAPVTHIGIYVGENQMLHCGDPIKYASIDSDYWSSHIYGFGRLINQ
ncbi:MAG: C40 family peptidase [Clostridia bacterium]|nr:C40 family peptidase [Clostridia bacterium]